MKNLSNNSDIKDICKSYEENISAHLHYKQMVQGIVMRGKDIQTKHKLLLDTNDIVNTL
jgi:hypothetical protein